MPPDGYYQYPPPFELPDEAVVAGRRFTGHRARVFHLLRITRERGFRHYIGRHLGPAGAVPVFLLREPWSGGQSGARRLRELRAYGLAIEISTFDHPDGDSVTTLYTLAGTLPASSAPVLATARRLPPKPGSVPAPRITLTRHLQPGALDLTPHPPTAPGERPVLVPSWWAASMRDYREQLQEAGLTRLLAEVRDGMVVVATAECLDELGWDPLPVLADALRAAGVIVEVEGL